MKLTVRPGRPTTLLNAVALLLLLITTGSMVRSVHATPASITDSTPGTATVDGTIGPLEYSGSTEGINTGGGSTLGQGAYLYIDSGGPQEEVVFALRPAGQLLNFVVIYIDSVGGGLADTTELEDLSDYYTMAVSGTNHLGSANLHFGPDFAPDYALVFNASNALLYQLVDGTPDTLAAAGTVNLQPVGDPYAGQYEMSISMSDIGVAAGGSFKYMATLTGPDITALANFYRYNEFNGISQSTYDAQSANLHTDFSLGSGDYHTFTTMGPTAVGQLNSGATFPATTKGVAVLFLVVLLLSASSLFLIRRYPV